MTITSLLVDAYNDAFPPKVCIKNSDNLDNSELTSGVLIPLGQSKR